MYRLNRSHVFLLACLVLGGGLRLVGLTRGDDGTAFHTFHPDETMVVQTALAPLDLTDPPITTYGMLPSYVLRGVVELSALVLGWEEVGGENAAARRRVYYIARLLAVLYSMGVLVLVWLLGRRYFGTGAAVLALLCVTFSTGAIQQAHFYIVDGLFVLLSTGCLWTSARALEGRDGRWYVATGVLIGLTGAVRLNGLLLGLILLVGYVWTGGIDWRSKIARLGQVHLWLAGAVALLVLLAVQPFLLTAPERMWQVNSARDFAFSLQVVRGEMLQPWLLVDVHTTPFVYHWTHLWPLLAGWPLTLFFVAALAYAMRRASVAQGLLLLWCGLYFLMVGGLVAKSVRYVMPMLPFLALFAGQLGVALWRLKAPWARAIVVGVWVHFTLYGCAFARLYTSEDSRIQAAKWIREQIPVSKRIGAENGGFSMRGVLEESHTLVPVDVPRLFYSGPYMLCSAQIDHLGQRLEKMEYLAIIAENRQAQFSSVPEYFPVVADFYRQLSQGGLGFELVQRFRHYPGFGSWEWIDDGAEPSFLGYDHPTVLIFKLRDPAVLAAGLQRWKQELAENAHCPDAALGQVAAAMQAGDWPSAQNRIDAVLQQYPAVKLAHCLEAEIYRHLGQTERVKEAMAHYRPEERLGPMTHVGSTALIHYVAPSAAGSLARLGLADLALQLLLEVRIGRSSEAIGQVVDEYMSVAAIFFERQQPVHMEKVLQYANRIHPSAKVTNLLAKLAYQRDEVDAALALWKKSLALDEVQVEAHRNLGLVILLRKGEHARAVPHLERAVQLDSTLAEEVQQWLIQAGF